MELLERESHLAALAAAWQEARKGHGRIALVSGEAGIGKTSLVRHFTAEITPPARLLRGACDALFTPRPLGPLYDIAPQAGSPLLDQLHEGSDWLAIARTLLADLERRTAVIVIEDVHWADEATLDLLKFLGRRIGQTDSLLILTFRNDELHAQHPLHILLGDLATTGLLQRIPLYGLSVDAVSTLSGDKGIDVTSLHRQTNGNPFFVTEVLAGEMASGVDSDIPATVRDAVLARSARLTPSARTVLEAAAVIGTRIEPWLLAEVTDAESTAAEACLAIGVLQTQGDSLTFRHELARQVILDTTSPPQKLTLHRLVLAALQASPVTQQDVARLAHHAEAAADQQAVLQYVPAAARQAVALGAHREAAAYYQTALGAMPAADGLRQQMQAAGVRGIPRGPRAATQQNPFGLSPRQMAVLGLLAEGLSNNEIAARLTISPRTVEHHVTAVFTKLNVNSRQEALALVWEYNLLSKKLTGNR